MQFEGINDSGLSECLNKLKLEHRDLNDVIAAFSSVPGFNQIQLRRLKRRKLQLKDLIARIESRLIPSLHA